MAITYCARCETPVGMRPGSERGREVVDGKWVHSWCAHRTPDQDLWDEIFGTGADRQLQRRAADQGGAALGHRVILESTQAGWQWRCLCGMLNSTEPRSDKHAQREHARQHLRDAIVTS